VSRRMGTAARLAGVVLLTGGLASFPGTAHADDVYCSQLDEEKVQQTDADNQPYLDMSVPEARDKYDGSGITIAIIDAGLAANAWLPHVVPVKVAGSKDSRDPNAYLSAGLAVGAKRNRDQPMGMAPGASLIGVQVYDGEQASDGEQKLTSANVAAGITAALAHGADVIAVDVATDDSSELRSAVARAVKSAVVVASIGTLPQPEGNETPSADPSEDFKSYPASYDGVLGVSVAASAGVELSGSIPTSSSIDVVAPVFGAVSTVKNGSSCLLDEQYQIPSLATGEVAGLAALLRDRYAADNPAQISERIKETATSATGDRSLVDGFGTIQPVDAMTRKLKITKAGGLDQAHQEVDRPAAVPPPDPEDDPFFSMRDSMRWWGVLAGGGLLLALILRPLLRR